MIQYKQTILFKDGRSQTEGTWEKLNLHQAKTLEDAINIMLNQKPVEEYRVRIGEALMILPAVDVMACKMEFREVEQ